MREDSKPFAKAKRALFRALKARRVVRVDIGYNGESDSGQIGDICAIDANGDPVSLEVPIKIALREGNNPVSYGTFNEALDDFAWTVLDHYHGGFENNDGGFGNIKIDVPKRSVTLDHNDRIVQSINTETEV